MTARVKAKNRAAWRAWLRANHAKKDEIWLLFAKKGSGIESIAYMESVEEALCFGWIDGLKRRVDDRYYMHRFTPRRPGSKWSPGNLELAKKLIASRKMTAAGRRAYEQRQEYAVETKKLLVAKEVDLLPEIARELRKHKAAWKNLQAMAPSHRKRYALWLNTAKRPETRAKRLAAAIESLKKNEKPGMK